MGEGWEDRVEETGTEEGVGLCGGYGYLEDGLIRDLRDTRVWRKAGRKTTDILLGISRSLELIGMSEERRTTDEHLPN